MNKIKKRFVTLLMITMYFGAFAQREASKTLTFKDKIKDLIVVPFNGISVVSEGDNVHGYDPTKEEVIWSVKKKESLFHVNMYSPSLINTYSMA